MKKNPVAILWRTCYNHGMDTIQSQNIGYKVRQMRQDKEWTQEKLAEIAGMDQADVCKIEKGVRRIGLRYARKLGSAFGVPYINFLDDASFC